MERFTWKAYIIPGMLNEYIKRHDEIWPELSAQKFSDDNTSDSLAQTEIVKKWWARMADIMDTNPDNSPVCVPLQEVFHLD